MQILMSSRRTVMSGEVVTFATAFEPWDSAFGKAYRAKGPFEVSASRDAVVVHRAECTTGEQTVWLCEALRFAEIARIALEPTWRGGAPSKYPEEPTACSTPLNEKPHPGEPKFVLLGRDEIGASLVALWADARESLGEDPTKLAEARECAGNMLRWCAHEANKAPVDPLRLLPFDRLARDLRRRGATVTPAAHDGDGEATTA